MNIQLKQELRELVIKAVENMAYDEDWDFKGMSSARAAEISEELMYASEELKEFQGKYYPNLDNDGCPKAAAKELETLFED